MRKITKHDWSFVLNELSEHLYSDGHIHPYPDDIKRVAIKRVLEKVKDHVDDAIKADAINITGSVLKSVSKRKPNSVLLSTASFVYDTADAFGGISTNENAAYDAITVLSKAYADNNSIQRIRTAANVYRLTTEWAGRARTILFGYNNIVKNAARQAASNQPLQSTDLDKAYNVAYTVDQLLEYIPFWSGALYLALKSAVRQEVRNMYEDRMKQKVPEQTPAYQPTAG